MRPAALWVLVTWKLATTVVAQQSPGPPVQTYRTSTRLVQVSVVVHDNRGRAIEGLQAQDFQIFEDGREHPVSLMHVGRASSEPEAAAAARGVFTNRIQNTAGGGVVALVYDRLNTSWSDQVQARDHILKFLGQNRSRQVFD